MANGPIPPTLAEFQVRQPGHKVDLIRPSVAHRQWGKPRTFSRCRGDRQWSMMPSDGSIPQNKRQQCGREPIPLVNPQRGFRYLTINFDDKDQILDMLGQTHNKEQLRQHPNLFG
jgi:hypothetical protein